MKSSLTVFALILAAAIQPASLCGQEDAQSDPPYLSAPAAGYTDTPLLPDSKWRVHDKARPLPPFVGPAAQKLPTAPPSDAIILIGKDGLDAWESWNGKKAAWDFDSGVATVNGGGDIRTRQSFGDCQLHLEWMSPPTKSSSQGANNSGVYLMGLYEIQILDSWSSRTYPDGQAAAMYGQYPPLVNASRPPGEWQSYDIAFTAPRFDDDKLLSPARLTLFHNGVLVHHNRAFIGRTSHKKVAGYEAHPAKQAMRLQDHGNPVSFRNIWIRPLD